MLDRISILGLRVYGHHGVLAHEREVGQEFIVDAVLRVDTAAAAAADDLARTADYGGIADALEQIVAGPPVQLIETLADRLATACLADPAVREVEITVHKPHAPLRQSFSDVTVTIRRVRSPAPGEPASQPAVLALGSNLGDRLANLQLAVDALDGDGLTVTAVSGVFETAPVGGPAQDDYLNAVLLADAAIPARAVLARCQAAEEAAGRVRSVRWGPRTLDVDVISYGSVVSADPDLTLPHPRAHERAFVLAPWLDVDPAARLPGRGPVAELLASTGTAGVTRRPDLLLRPRTRKTLRWA